jgi:uncharacterized protein (TIGR02996 family)
MINVPEEKSMNTESALQQGIVENPDDPDRWLILIDWLQEHDDPRRAELLRLHRQLIATCCEPEKHPERAQQQERMVQLLAEGVQPCIPRRTVTLAEGVEMMFAWIQPGTFLMGSPESEEGRKEDETQHLVTLTQPFWLGVTPVTQAQWQAVMGDNPSHSLGEDLPVQAVSWEDCQEFCRRLGERVGMPVRLPTEARWEYACRAGTTTPFFNGERLGMKQLIITDFNSSWIGEVSIAGKIRWSDSIRCNAWGLFSMHGFVREWCQDWYGPYGKGSVRDPQGPERGVYRVMRGTSRLDACSRWFREGCARREWAPPDEFVDSFGCRVVLCLD